MEIRPPLISGMSQVKITSFSRNNRQAKHHSTSAFKRKMHRARFSRLLILASRSYRRLVWETVINYPWLKKRQRRFTHLRTKLVFCVRSLTLYLPLLQLESIFLFLTIWSHFQVIGKDDKVVLVLHDWGSGLGFDWAFHNQHRIEGAATPCQIYLLSLLLWLYSYFRYLLTCWLKGIVFTEAIVAPFEYDKIIFPFDLLFRGSPSFFSFSAPHLFSDLIAFRSKPMLGFDLSKFLNLDLNFFVEAVSLDFYPLFLFFILITADVESGCSSTNVSDRDGRVSTSLSYSRISYSFQFIPPSYPVPGYALWNWPRLVPIDGYPESSVKRIRAYSTWCGHSIFHSLASPLI